MAVLAREIDAYNRALEAYKRQLASHNAGVSAYQETLVNDANGNPIILYGGTYYAVPKDGGDPYVVGGLYDAPQYNQYGTTPAADNPGVEWLRQNPTNTTTNQVKLMYGADEGGGYYYTVDDQGLSTGVYTPARTTQITQNPDGTYTATEYAYEFTPEPGKFDPKGLMPKRPDPTLAQMRKLGQPSLAAQERGGLLGDVIRSNGLASGIGGGTVAQQKAPVEEAPPETPEPETPPAPPPEWDWGGSGP